ncbi:MAG: 3'-5' exonuclease [Bacteroidota bacterium]
MKYIIVDLEATCWATKDKNNTNEIIEIGAICINSDKETESEFSEFIKPTLYPVLSDFCTKLTSITQKDIETADTFEKVIERFKAWIPVSEDYLLCSWGFYDKSQFISDCNLHHTDATWVSKHISLKHQHTDIKKLNRPVGMSGALKMDGIALQGIHHRGIDDARNISKLFLKYFDHWKFKTT